MKPLDELLAPIGGESPTGPDLDESAEFDRLRTAFEINFPLDAKVVDAEEGAPSPAPVDWEALRDEIETLCDQTKDLFLAVSYARCGLVIGDLETVERGLMFVAGLLESYWEGVNPPIDGPMGYPGRAGILENIAQRGAFGIPFLQMAVLRDGRTALTAEQLTDTAANGAASDHFASVRRLLDGWGDEQKQAVDARLTAIFDAVGRIDQAMKQHGAGPDFSTTRDILEMVQNAFVELAGLSSPDGQAGSAAEADGAPAAATSGDTGGAAFSGHVRSRDDVLRALTEIEQYYARAEPGHPVKVAAARLRGWVTKDFMAILEDIVPGSVDDAKNVLLERHNVE